MLTRIARRPGHSRTASIATIIQLALAAFVVDLVLGYTIVEHYFGSSPSASWISKSIFIYPCLVLFFSGYFLRYRKHRLKLQRDD
jgi:hypothetical protein